MGVSPLAPGRVRGGQAPQPPAPPWAGAPRDAGRCGLRRPPGLAPRAGSRRPSRPSLPHLLSTVARLHAWRAPATTRCTACRTTGFALGALQEASRVRPCPAGWERGGEPRPSERHRSMPRATTPPMRSAPRAPGEGQEAQGWRQACGARQLAPVVGAFSRGTLLKAAD